MRSPSLLKSTFVVTSSSFLGIILGFIVQVLVAFFFGATMERDAYFAAMVIPTYVNTLFAGSLGAMFMSSYISNQTHKTTAETSDFVCRVINLTGAALLFLTITGAFFAEDIVSIIAPGFGSSQSSLTSSLLIILMPSTVFTALSSLLTTTYQANGRFLLPAIAPVFGTLITLGVVLSSSREIGIRSLAYGSLAASVFNFAALAPILFKTPYKFGIFLNDEVMRLLVVAAPLFIMGIIYRSSTMFERMIASTLPQGSISYLGYAQQMMAYLSMLSSGGIATTIYPLISKNWEIQKLQEVREDFGKGIRIVLIVTMPVAIIFVLLGKTIVGLLFQRGAFDAAATSAVSLCLTILMIALVCLSIGNITAKCLYLSRKTTVFSLMAAFEVVLYLCLGYLLSRTYSYVGLAIAYSFSVLITMVLSFFVLRRVFEGLNERELLRSVGRIVTASLSMGVAVFVFFESLDQSLVDVPRAIVAAILGLSVYFTMLMYIFPVQDAAYLKNIINKFVFGLVKEKVQ